MRQAMMLLGLGGEMVRRAGRAAMAVQWRREREKERKREGGRERRGRLRSGDGQVGVPGAVVQRESRAATAEVW